MSEIFLGTHTGTHIDPPYHFLETGCHVDELPLQKLIGQALVADLTHVTGTIEPSHLESLRVPSRISRLLLKTRNSDLWPRIPIEFPSEYVHLSHEAAKWVVEKGFDLVGTDFLSIEARGNPGHPVHLTLLEAEVVIVEGLNLYHVEPGIYELICLPLRLEGGDGSPARAVLIDRSQ